MYTLSSQISRTTELLVEYSFDSLIISVNILKECPLYHYIQYLSELHCAKNPCSTIHHLSNYNSVRINMLK